MITYSPYVYVFFALFLLFSSLFLYYYHSRDTTISTTNKFFSVASYVFLFFSFAFMFRDTYEYYQDNYINPTLYFIGSSFSTVIIILLSIVMYKYFLTDSDSFTEMFWLFPMYIINFFVPILSQFLLFFTNKLKLLLYAEAKKTTPWFLAVEYMTLIPLIFVFVFSNVEFIQYVALFIVNAIVGFLFYYHDKNYGVVSLNLGFLMQTNLFPILDEPDEDDEKNESENTQSSTMGKNVTSHLENVFRVIIAPLMMFTIIYFSDKKDTNHDTKMFTNISLG